MSMEPPALAYRNHLQVFPSVRGDRCDWVTSSSGAQCGAPGELSALFTTSHGGRRLVEGRRHVRCAWHRKVTV